jgi:hypothetical protein
MAFYIELDHAPDEIVTLQEFKQQLKEVDPTQEHPEDTLFQGYIDAAVEECESYINRAIVTRKYRISGKSFLEATASSLHTVISIDEIAYKPVGYTAGDLTVLGTENYTLSRVDSVENKIEFLENSTLPEVREFTPDAVQVSITVGMQKAYKKIKQAVLLKAVAMDQLRADYVKNKTTASERLLQTLIKY